MERRLEWRGGRVAGNDEVIEGEKIFDNGFDFG